MAPPKIRHKVSVRAVGIFNLCQLLNSSEYTAAELSAITGMTLETVCKHLRLLKARKLIYVCEWRKTHAAGAPARVWTWGFETEDARRPKRKTQAEYSATHKARKNLKLLEGVKHVSQGQDISGSIGR